MPRGDTIYAKGMKVKDYYPITEEERISITKPETKEERQAYFDFLDDCISNHICTDCGKEIVIDETWLKDEIRELQFSGMCNICQREVFGR